MFKKDKKKIKINIKNILFVFLGFLSIILIGIFIIFLYTDKIEKEVKAGFFDYTNIFVSSINSEKVKNLTNDEKDLSNPDYQRISEQLLKMENVSKNIGVHWIYTMFLKDGQIIFGPDSIPAGEFGHSNPGDVFKDPSLVMKQSFLNVLEKGSIEMLGPDTDIWGTWLSALVPISDFKTGQIIGVLGADIDYSYYRSVVFNKQLLLIISLILVLFLFVGVSFYIINVKRITNKIKENERQQQIILDAIPAWVFYKDSNNNFIKVNKVFADSMKMSKEQLEGKSGWDYYPKEQADAYWKDDKEVIEKGISKVNIVEPFETPSGKFWMRTDKIPYTNEKGEIIGIIGFAIDITLIKQSEDNLKKHNEEVEKLNKLMIGRELEMVNLKEEIAKLKNNG